MVVESNAAIIHRQTRSFCFLTYAPVFAFCRLCVKTISTHILGYLPKDTGRTMSLSEATS